MSKEHTNYPSGKLLQAVIHETKYRILMNLYLKGSKFLENDISFKEFQDALGLRKVSPLGMHGEYYPVSRKAFERALGRAKRDGWIFLHRQTEQEGMNPVKTFRLGLTEKGLEVATRERQYFLDF